MPKQVIKAFRKGFCSTIYQQNCRSLWKLFQTYHILSVFTEGLLCSTLWRKPRPKGMTGKMRLHMAMKQQQGPGRNGYTQPLTHGPIHWLLRESQQTQEPWTLRTGSVSPPEQAPALCFNKEHDKGSPASGGKTEWLIRSPLYIGRRSPCVFKISVRISVLQIAESGQLGRVEDVSRSGDVMKAKYIRNRSPFNRTSLNQLWPD